MCLCLGVTCTLYFVTCISELLIYIIIHCMYCIYIYIYTSIYMYVVSLATDEGEFIILALYSVLKVDIHVLKVHI